MWVLDQYCNRLVYVTDFKMSKGRLSDDAFNQTEGWWKINDLAEYDDQSKCLMIMDELINHINDGRKTIYQFRTTEEA